MNKKKINIIGRGNVGTHLTKAFSERFEVFRVNPHSLAELDEEADLTVIAVSDSVIPQIAERLGHLKGIVAHTSGATSIDVLSGEVKRPAVFYPLQTFSKEREMDYSAVPLFVEAQEERDLSLVKSIAEEISDNVKVVDSATRERIHLAAVFANNFANHMVTVAQTLLVNEGLDPSLLTPLINETFTKLETQTARESQTGPAHRGDITTIERHLSLLSGRPEFKRLYLDVSQSIMDIESPKEK